MPGSIMWQQSSVYPDPAIEILDPSFEKYRIGSAAIERLATGMRWSEGPVWFGDGRYLLWSDIPNNRIMRWDEETGAVSVFRKPSNNSNGNTRDRQGRLVSCEHGTRRVTRTEYDGAITVLCDSFDGKRLNSPNDIVVKSDGSIWFTIRRSESSATTKATRPSRCCRRTCIASMARPEQSLAVGRCPGPNGLCFSPDESLLYVVECRAVPTA